MNRENQAKPRRSKAVWGPGAVAQEVQVAIAHDDGGDTDGNVDIENGLPAKVVRQDAAEGWGRAQGP